MCLALRTCRIQGSRFQDFGLEAQPLPDLEPRLLVLRSRILRNMVGDMIQVLLLAFTGVPGLRLNGPKTASYR